MSSHVAAGQDVAHGGRRDVDQMQSYWADFARTGAPNGANFPPWHRYNRTDDSYVAISATRTASLAHLRADVCPLYVSHWSDPMSYDSLTEH